MNQKFHIHRIGRTARAGQKGVALNFVSKDEREFLKNIESLTNEKIVEAKSYPFKSNVPFKNTNTSKTRKNQGRKNKSKNKPKKSKRKKSN